MSLIDTDLLYRTLDAERQARGLSWRDVAAETGLSPSTFSRLPGQYPSLDGCLTMCRWLGMPMETFSTLRAGGVCGSLGAELVTLLDRHGVPSADREVVLAMIRVYLASRDIPLAGPLGACHTE